MYFIQKPEQIESPSKKMKLESATESSTSSDADVLSDNSDSETG